MASSFRTILSPVDFDENSLRALDTAAELARLAGATVFVLHVSKAPGSTAAAVDVDACVAQEQAAKRWLVEVCGNRLAGLRYEVLTRTGDPAIAIIRAAAELNADLVVVATHARRPKPNAFPGSVAERVVRESICPVVTVRPSAGGDPDAVGSHMTKVPLTASPDMTVDYVRQMMTRSRVRSVPVLANDKLVGLITDRDFAFSDATPDTAIGLLMTREVVTISPMTSIQEAARMLLECEVDALPVMDNDKLAGIITRSDILGAFSGAQPAGTLAREPAG
jgi:CBS domain-containing protein